MILQNELKLIDQVRANGFRPEVVGCFIHNAHLLMLYSKEHNLWQFPQGGIKNKENIETAINREMYEELDKDFINNCRLDKIFYHDRIEFKNFDKNLQLDNGKNIQITGKEYIFIKIDAPNDEIDINKTQFDDYKWCDYAGAIELANQIYQAGKKRITAGAIKTLKEFKMI